MESKPNLDEWTYYIARGTTSYFYHIQSRKTIKATTDPIQADAFQVIEHTNQIYVIGGNIKNEAINAVFMLTFPNIHLTIKRNLNIPRWAFGCCKNDKFIYALGGYNGSKCLQEVEQYDPIKDMWIYLPSMNEGKTSCGSCATNYKLFAFGGFRHKFGTVSSLEILDLRSPKEWSKSLVSTKFGTRSACGCIQFSIDSTKVLIFGGLRTSTEFMSDSWMYDTNSKEMFPIDAKMRMTDYFSCSSNCLGYKCDGKMYALGSETMNIHIYDSKSSKWEIIQKDKWIM